MMDERRGVPIGALAGLLGARLVGDPGVRVTDVTHDSRQAGPGWLFVAVPGYLADGHSFVTEALRQGAAAVCVERVTALGVPQLVVEDGRAALPQLAAEVHGHPSRRLALVGVTGTNGKTTVTHMMEAIAEAAGLRSGLVGTVGARIAGRPTEVARTTPESSDLQRLLARMVEEGVELAALEVSSHALALGRVDVTWFEVAAFTNLSQDHLDFHGDLDSYFAAKASLFRPERIGRAVVFIDDPAGRELFDSQEVPALSVGFGAEAQVRGEDMIGAPGESVFSVRTRSGSRKVRLPLGGDFNVANALIALGCALAIGLPLEIACAGLEGMTRVPGRFEPVEAGQDFAVIVDYAHTPEGVEVVVSSARRLTSGRVIAVVGAGGDRDRRKRPLMGRAAAGADLVVVTSDNPRSEDPAGIVAAVAGGGRGGSARLVEEPDRRAAIRTAIRAAGPGDVVLIMGKGHEPAQEVGGRLIPFDDRQVAREELEAL